VIVGIVWVLDLQARILKLSSKYEKLFSGAVESGEGTPTAAMLANLAARLEETTARTERLVGYRARIRNHGHSCFLCEIVIRSQFHTTYEPEA
jgi:hypothetical protein